MSGVVVGGRLWLKRRLPGGVRHCTGVLGAEEPSRVLRVIPDSRWRFLLKSFSLVLAQTGFYKEMHRCA